jgi:Cell division septal protein
MLATGFLFTLVTGPTAFGVSRTDLPPLTWTDPAVVRAALGLTDGTNVFRLDTAPLEAALRALPAVASADVSVGLPDAVVVVSIQERTPVLAWQVAETRFLADANGTIFAMVDAKAALPPGVVVVEDRRITAGDALAIGAHVDAVDADVATRLGSLTPTDVGSSATRLRLVITDADGFVISTPDGWTAVFGFYSPATRSTDMIPGQVRLLRSLLAGREGTVARIILASETDGTYIPKAAPKPSTR